MVSSLFGIETAKPSYGRSSPSGQTRRRSRSGSLLRWTATASSSSGVRGRSESPGTCFSVALRCSQPMGVAGITQSRWAGRSDPTRTKHCSCLDGRSSPLSDEDSGGHAATAFEARVSLDRHRAVVRRRRLGRYAGKRGPDASVGPAPVDKGQCGVLAMKDMERRKSSSCRTCGSSAGPRRRSAHRGRSGSPSVRRPSRRADQHWTGAGELRRWRVKIRATLRGCQVPNAEARS
jgi:hypothetical protein